MKLFKQIYWAIAVIALVLAVYFAPKMVEYEWGIGAYIAIGWGVFLFFFGSVALFSDKIKKYLENKQ